MGLILSLQYSCAFVKRLPSVAGVWPALALALLLFLPLPAAGAPPRGSGDLWNHYSIRDGLPSANVSAAFRAGDGSLWFGTDSGAARYDGSWQVVVPANGLPVGRVRAIAQATDGAIWLGLDRNGVARRAGDRCCQSWNRANGLPSADVRALMPAPDGGMWIGTGAGAVFLRRLEDGAAGAAGRFPDLEHRSWP